MTLKLKKNVFLLKIFTDKKNRFCYMTKTNIKHKNTISRF